MVDEKACLAYLKLLDSIAGAFANDVFDTDNKMTCDGIQMCLTAARKAMRFKDTSFDYDSHNALFDAGAELVFETSGEEPFSAFKKQYLEEASYTHMRQSG